MTKDNLLSFTPTDLPISKEDYVYKTIREAIISGYFEPGMRLNQAKLVDWLEVSSIPVRSAIQRLVQDGLVYQEPHQSAEVSSLSIGDLEEILLIRMHLELLATRESILNITPLHLAELRIIFDKMTNAIEQDAYALYGALNKEFHLKLYEACPYKTLCQLIKDLWDNSDRFRSRAMFSLIPDLAKNSHHDHIKLLELIQSKKVNETVMLMEEHKAHARNELINYLKELKQ